MSFDLVGSLPQTASQTRCMYEAAQQVYITILSPQDPATTTYTYTRTKKQLNHYFLRVFRKGGKKRKLFPSTGGRLPTPYPTIYFLQLVILNISFSFFFFFGLRLRFSHTDGGEVRDILTRALTLTLVKKKEHLLLILGRFSRLPDCLPGCNCI